MPRWPLLLVGALVVCPQVLAFPSADCPGTSAVVEPLAQSTVRRQSLWGLQWAFELPPPESASFSGSVSWIADTLGVNSTKEVSISACPGDFDVPPGCRGTGWDGSLAYRGGTAPPADAELEPACQLQGTGPHYLNIRDYDCPSGEICSFALSWHRAVVAADTIPVGRVQPEPPRSSAVAGGTEAADGESADCPNPLGLLLTQRSLDPETGEVLGMTEPADTREGFVSGQAFAYRLQTLGAADTPGRITLTALEELDGGASEITIARCPGTFSGDSVVAGCVMSGPDVGLPYRVSEPSEPGVCTLAPESTYYVNVRNDCALGALCGFRLDVVTGYEAVLSPVTTDQALPQELDLSEPAATAQGDASSPAAPVAVAASGVLTAAAAGDDLIGGVSRTVTEVTGGVATLTTPTIVAETSSAALACANWRVIGACFWLQCGWTGCSIRVSTKVAHYNPDLVVGVYNELGGNPWREARAVLGTAQKAAVGGLLGRLLGIPVDSAGNFTEGPAGGNRGHQNTIFREADAIGHPLSLDALSALGFGYVCPAAATTPMVPYFQSALDALAWRTEIPESFFPASWIPGLREVGTWPLQTWGGVYPRTGWSTQAEEPKAAALAAQRAGDIVTRLGQPHVYLPLATGFIDTVVPADALETFAGGGSGVRTVNRMRTWLPPQLVENDARTGTWQMLMPTPEASCAAFGENDLVRHGGWGGGRVSAGGDYAWNLWRPYRCCRVRGQYLFSIEVDYP